MYNQVEIILKMIFISSSTKAGAKTALKIWKIVSLLYPNRKDYLYQRKDHKIKIAYFIFLQQTQQVSYQIYRQKGVTF